jgi:hypothetical protein
MKINFQILPDFVKNNNPSFYTIDKIVILTDNCYIVFEKAQTMSMRTRTIEKNI